jgi:putative resolvase
MKLSAWAKQKGIHYQTAWKWFKAGQIEGAYATEHGTIFVESPQNAKRKNQFAVVYARVSNFSRKKELDYQVKRCEDFASAAGISIDKSFKEVASGMNENRKVFWRMLELNPSLIIVENKDRLSRFGFNYIEKLLKESGCEILVINKSQEDREDLIKDLVSIIYSFCARLYGMRRAKNKADQLKKIVNQND